NPVAANLLKEQLAGIGVIAQVDVLDRQVFIRRISKDRDWDQLVMNTGAQFDPNTVSMLMDAKGGNNTTNQSDKRLEEFILRLRQAASPHEFLEAGYDFQRYASENMLAASLTCHSSLQAARNYVKGYEYMNGYRLRFEGTWLDQGEG